MSNCSSNEFTWILNHPYLIFFNGIKNSNKISSAETTIDLFLSRRFFLWFFLIEETVEFKISASGLFRRICSISISPFDFVRLVENSCNIVE